MQIQQTLHILRENWWVVLAIVLICAGAGLAFSYSQTPIYEATATFVVNPGVGIAQTDDVLYSIDTLASRTTLATTYSNILESRIIIEAAAASLGISSEMLADYTINSVVLPDSSVLMLQIQGPSPELAADLTNTIGAAGLDYISNSQEIYELRPLDPAVSDPTPISPNHLVDFGLAFMIGLTGGVAFVILRQFLSQSFAHQDQSKNVPTPA
jgi:capsular polysaccharide biosynthesis protein